MSNLHGRSTRFVSPGFSRKSNILLGFYQDFTRILLGNYDFLAPPRPSKDFYNQHIA